MKYDQFDEDGFTSSGENEPLWSFDKWSIITLIIMVLWGLALAINILKV